MQKKTIMQDLRNLEKSELIDLLTRETTRYYKMSKNGGDKQDYDQCKATIEKIQSELKYREKAIKKY